MCFWCSLWRDVDGLLTADGSRVVLELFGHVTKSYDERVHVTGSELSGESDRRVRRSFASGVALSLMCWPHRYPLQPLSGYRSYVRCGSELVQG